jgi:hypothetical protein
MKKIAFLAALTAIGALLIAATCTIRGATITVINDEVWYSAEMEYDDGPNLLNHKFAVGFIEGNTNPATKTVDGCLRSLQSGNSNFYSANSGLDEGDADTAVSRLVGPLTFGDTVNGDITFSHIDVTRDNETLIVNGRIENDDNDDLENLRVCVVVRNDDGDVTVVDVDNNEYDLDAGDTADFSVETDVPDDNNDVDTVDLWIDGTNADEDDRVTEPQSDLDNNVDECGAATATATPGTPTNTPIAGTPTATATPPNAC